MSENRRWKDRPWVEAEGVAVGYLGIGRLYKLVADLAVRGFEIDGPSGPGLTHVASLVGPGSTCDP